MEFFKAFELDETLCTDSFYFFNKFELLAWFDVSEEDVEEDFVDILDGVGGDVGGECEDFEEWDGF